MTEITHEVLRRNQHLLRAGDDYWLGQRVSRGIAAVGDEGWEDDGPSIIVDCRPLPFKARAKHYRDGIKVIVPSVRRTPPYALIAAHQDAQLPQHGDGGPRGARAGPGGLGGAARRARQPVRRDSGRMSSSPSDGRIY